MTSYDFVVSDPVVSGPGRVKREREREVVREDSEIANRKKRHELALHSVPRRRGLQLHPRCAGQQAPGRPGPAHGDGWRSVSTRVHNAFRAILGLLGRACAAILAQQARNRAGERQGRRELCDAWILVLRTSQFQIQKFVSV